jgi:GT2 family glycosyltransferase
MPSGSSVRSARVAVVVLNYNGLSDTVKCLASLKAVRHSPLSVIVVDNGSQIDPTEAVHATFPDAVVLCTGENLGYAGGNNRGIRLAMEQGTEFVLVLNNDTTVSPVIVESLIEAFATDDTLGIVGPVINHMDEPHTIMTDGVCFNPGPGAEFFQRKAIATDPGGSRPTTVDIVNGCCMMIKAEALNAIGAFDESFFIVHEESDLCLRAQRAGFRCAVLGKSLVWHKGSSSFDRSGRQFQRYFDTRNLYFLLKRHAGRVGSSRSFGKSLWPYLRYVSYRYEIEAEANKPRAARAVAEGLRDAFVANAGPYLDKPRVGTQVIKAALGGFHRLSRARRALLGTFKQ